MILQGIRVDLILTFVPIMTVTRLTSKNKPICIGVKPKLPFRNMTAVEETADAAASPNTVAIKNHRKPFL